MSGNGDKVKAPLWAVFLLSFVILWVGMTGSIAADQLLWAAVIGPCTLPLVDKILDLARRLSVRRILRQAVGVTVAFFVLFVPDAIRVEFGGPIDTLLLCNHVTLTPGSVVVDMDQERGLLYLHVIDATHPEQIEREVRALHRRARRLIGV